jgi:RND family efflux transporter MFP subunit
MGSSDTTRRHAIVAVLLCSAILTGGIVLKVALGAMREAPAQIPIAESVLRVEVMPAAPRNVPVLIRGYGEVAPREQFTLTAKVAGDIVEVHPKFVSGGIVPEGEVLVRIDPRDYEAALRQAEARVGQIESMLALIEQQIALDTERLKTLARSREIAREEYERDKALYEVDDIGTQTMVNLTELKYNEATALFEQLEQAIALYPIKAEEARSGLDAARAAVELAQLQLARTEVRAPFDARIKQTHVDVGQPVAPGAPAAVIANDTALEITVPIDSNDARRWLRFEESAPPVADDAGEEASWFGALTPVVCRITWSEDAEHHVWEGTLDRVERFDQSTRTVHVAIAVTQKQARAGAGQLPLVEGMFCVVTIPGRVLENVVPVPRTAVDFDGELYLAAGDRLERRTVQVVRIQEELALIGSGVEAGELIVITRLADPVPGARLSYTAPGDAGEASSAADATSLEFDTPAGEAGAGVRP